MALLIRTLVLLSVPHLTSWDTVHSPHQHSQLQESQWPAKFPELVPPKTPDLKWDASSQQQRIKQMGTNGVIYFDAPPTISRRRILR